jgi:hypothetical protein
MDFIIITHTEEKHEMRAREKKRKLIINKYIIVYSYKKVKGEEESKKLPKKKRIEKTAAFG